ncbi:MAG TPA: energy transducer TonB [Flavobacteriales bacterium]|nr:energy transducer TonB [Flavobacteriales bacterium]
MKIISILSLSLPCIQAFAQEAPAQIIYEVRGTYTRPVKPETLANAKTLADICPGYPATWITNYTKTEISTFIDGKQVNVPGKNDTLSAAQKALLANIELGSNVDFSVAYTYANAVTGNNDAFEMIFTLTVVPSVQAEFAGGYAQMQNYFKEKAIDKISAAKAKTLKQAAVRFTVDEQGEIVNAYMSGSTHDKKTNKLLLKAVNNMPKWKPAENAQGLKVKQEFEFVVYGEMMMTGC